MLDINRIYYGDCLEIAKEIEVGSIDLILIDPPYGNMKGAPLDGWKNARTDWDKSIPPTDLFNISYNILRQSGKLIIFSQEPYTTQLISNAHYGLPFNYRMIWEKDHFANGLLAKKAPVNYFEDILVFGKKYDSESLHPLRPYFKEVLDFIGLNLHEINKKLGHRKAEHTFYVTSKNKVTSEIENNTDCITKIGSTQFSLCSELTYNELIDIFGINKMPNFKTYDELQIINNRFIPTFNLWEGGKFKGNILKYKKDYDKLHPTQKPILLLEDIIKTFSNANDTIVDLTMGSGSTCVACINTNRQYIGIEKDPEYFKIASERVTNVKNQKLKQDLIIK